MRDNLGLLYFNGEHLTHTARVAEANELLLSKWGPSELIEHRLWEVPEGYGDTYKVAVPPPRKRVHDSANASSAFGCARARMSSASRARL